MKFKTRLGPNRQGRKPNALVWKCDKLVGEGWQEKGQGEMKDDLVALEVLLVWILMQT